MCRNAFATIFFIVFFVSALFVKYPAHAREGYFRPAQGETLSSAPGEEVATVGEEGGVSLFSASGVLLPGFPVFPDDQVAASSPLFARVFGNVAKEIVFLSRNASNEYALNVYDGAGARIGSVSLGAGDIFCEPVAVDITGTAAQGIVLAKDDGRVSLVRNSGGTLVESTMFDAGIPACAAWDAGRKELIINYPGASYADVYTFNGSAWSKNRRVALAKPLLYAVTPLGTSTWYGIDADNAVVAHDSATGALLSGFPKQLDASALASPILADVDSAQAGTELSVPIVGGKTVILKTDGTILDASFAQGPADDVQVLTSDKPSGILFAVRSFALRIFNSIEERIASIFGSIRRLLPSDLDGPLVSAVQTDKTAVAAGELVTLTAQADDAKSSVAAVEYHVRANADASPVVGGSGVAMQAADGAFDSASELASAVIDTAGWSGTGSPYTIHVLAQDANGNWSAVSGQTTLAVFGAPDFSIHLNDGSGCVASSDTGSSGSLGPNCASGNAPTWTTGIAGSALSFDATDDKVTFAPSSMFNPGSGSFSVSLWVKPLAPQAGQTGIVSSIGQTDYFIFELSGTRMAYEIRDSLGSGNYFYGASAKPLAMNAWNHLVYVINRETNTIDLYLNGALDKSVSVTIDESIEPNGALLLGRHVGVMNGSLDELLIYHRSLEPSEVQYLYSQHALAVAVPDTITLTFDQGSGCAITEQEGIYGMLGPDCANGNAPTWTSDAVSSTALLFDGVDDKVTFNTSPFFNPGSNSFSVSLWVKPLAPQAGQTGIVSSIGQTDYFIFELSGTRMAYEIRDNTGSGNYFYGASAKPLTLNAWNHLVYVINRENGTIDLYMNGALDKSVSVTIDEPIEPNGALLLGRHVGVLSGSMDEVALYHRALGSNEIQYLYSQHAPAIPDTLTLTFNQGTGCTITEQSGFYGTLGPACASGNAPAWTNDSVSSTALLFDGVDDKATFNTSPFFNPGSNSFSVSMWVKPMGSQGNQTGLVSSVGQTDYFIFELSGSNMFYEIRDNSGAGDRFFGWSANPLTLNAWNHLVYVINRETNTIGLYLNGVLDKSMPAAMDEPIEPNGGLLLGRHVYVLNGTMDELRVYRRALTPADVAELFEGGA